MLRKTATAFKLLKEGRLLEHWKFTRNTNTVRVWIVSYPKCGRTWLEVMLGKALCLEKGLPDENIWDLRRLTADAGFMKTFFTHDGADISFAKRYAELTTDKSYYKNKKVIILRRDYRDALVSCYFQATKRLSLFEGSLSEFIRDDRFGIAKIATFYDGWEKNKKFVNDYLDLSYEELHHTPEACLRSVLNFIGANDFPEGIVREAVEYARFDNLRALEKANRFDTAKLRPGDPSDRNSFKVRRGKVGGYEDYLSDEDLQYIDNVLNELGLDAINNELYARSRSPVSSAVEVEIGKRPRG